MAKKALGRGLEALIAVNSSEGGDIRELGINEVEPNRDQPRKNFDREKLEQLAESIRQHGIVQPIIVKKENDTYRIVAGERRWRAARIAGLTKIPVIIRDLSEKEQMEIALIENLQREDLNPIEEAEAYEKLMKEHNMTQEQLSQVIGKSRSAIANTVRLLTLSPKVREYIIEGKITGGHARTLVTIDNPQLQEKMAEEIIQKNLSVREAENLLKKYSKQRGKTPKSGDSVELRHIEERLKYIFGTQVKLISGNKKGKIVIEYYSPEELDRILEMVDSLNKG